MKFLKITILILAINISPHIYGQIPANAKIASHNSLTFADNLNGNDRIVDRHNRCQYLNIQEQYELGVRMFDFRVRRNRDGQPQAAHGRIVYSVNIEKEYEWLNSKRDVWIRIMLENRRLPRQRKKDFEWFRQYTAELAEKYPDIHFVGGYGSRSGGKIADNIPHQPLINQYIWNVENSETLLPHPRKYAETNNAGNAGFINSETWSMFDFVELLAE